MKTTLFLTAAIAASATFAPASQDCPATKVARATLASHGGQDIVDTAVAAGNFRTLAAALGAADLAEALKGEGPFTVFAPTDEAFAKLPEGLVQELLKPERKADLQAILKYHVVSGSVMAKDVSKLRFATTLNGQRVDIVANKTGVKIDGARVIKADIECTNGVIHVIDTVILPNMGDIVTTAVEAKTFNTLAAALGAAELVEVLQTPGPFTVFAPTDDAFAALPKGTVENLLKPENKEKLIAILKYHVVAGRVYSEQVVKLERADTILGRPVQIRVADEKVMINDATVIKADIEATNGVIHVVDRVLIPRE